MKAETAFMLGSDGKELQLINRRRRLIFSPRGTSPGLIVAIYAKHGETFSRIALTMQDGRPHWDGKELNYGDNWFTVTEAEAKTLLAYCDGLGLE